MSKRTTNTVQSVEHACDIIAALHAMNGGGVTEIADRTAVSKSTVHNHLATLERAGFVVRQDGRYRLSYRFLTLGGAIRDTNPLFRMSRDHIDDLAAETGDIAAATTEEGGQNVYLYVATGPNAVTIDIHLGTRLPLHCLASGKAILASLPDQRVEAIIDEHGLPAHTPNTITDREELLGELEQIRAQGYAFDNEERIQGMRAVAAPVRSETDDSLLGAIVVSGSTIRVEGDYFREELPEIVTRRAREIEINATYS